RGPTPDRTLQLSPLTFWPSRTANVQSCSSSAHPIGLRGCPMQRLISVMALSCLLAFILPLRAADEAPTIDTAQGVVDKADKEALTVKPRDKAGKFEKTLVLKLTGTSKASTLSTQTRDGK